LCIYIGHINKTLKIEKILRYITGIANKNKKQYIKTFKTYKTLKINE
jgi:hypothetical protein